VTQPGGDARLVEEHRDERVVEGKFCAQLLDDQELREPGETLEDGEVDDPIPPWASSAISRYLPR